MRAGAGGREGANGQLGDRGHHERDSAGAGGDGPRPYPPADIPPQRVDYWLDRLGIRGVQDQYPGQISGGQRQRAAIARTLVLEPSLLLMDEPFSSLDALTRENLEDLTLALQAETGITTVVVTHNIEEAAYLGDRILVLGRPPHRMGRLVENIHPERRDFRNHPAFQERCNQLRAALADGGREEGGP